MSRTVCLQTAGCILADDMGLGKTLQGISLMWTLLQGGHESLGGVPLAHRIIIVCPTSLVSNWDSECIKWLNVGVGEAWLGFGADAAKLTDEHAEHIVAATCPPGVLV